MAGIYRKIKSNAKGYVKQKGMLNTPRNRLHNVIYYIQNNKNKTKKQGFIRKRVWHGGGASWV